MKEKENNRKSYLKYVQRIFAIIILCLILSIGGMGIYLSIFYHAYDYELETVIDIKEEKLNRTSYTAFIPKEEIKAGLIFYPGAKVEDDAYDPLMERMARKGILCILIDMPYNIAFFNSNAAKGISECYPEVDDWYLCGHSLGGVVAENYLMKHEKEYKGMIFLASYGTKDISNTDLKVLSIYGDHDEVVNVDRIKEARSLMPDSYEEKIIEGANHANFGYYGKQKGDGTAEITAEEQWDITANMIETWMEFERP